MIFNNYLYMIFGIILNKIVYAESFIDSFDSHEKSNLNLYTFAADVDEPIKKEEIKYNIDQRFKEIVKELDHSFMAHAELIKGKWGIYANQQIIKPSQEKQTRYLPISINNQLDQGSSGTYYRAHISPAFSFKNLPKPIIEPKIGMHCTKPKASTLNQSTDIGSVWNGFLEVLALNTILIHLGI
ncbi:hypothetical protein [Acinetobacter sp. AS167]|uniref:hypothetical protein n=1 Tax=Acinetobacter sp. AS167 TaxID=3127884 RepID=UPI0030162F2D